MDVGNQHHSVKGKGAEGWHGSDFSESKGDLQFFLGRFFHLSFLQVLSQQKASFSSQWCNSLHINKVMLMEECTPKPRAGRTNLPHHESPATACEKALSFQPWRGYQIAFNVASISAGLQDVCLLQVSWELKNLFGEWYYPSKVLS